MWRMQLWGCERFGVTPAVWPWVRFWVAARTAVGFHATSLCVYEYFKHFILSTFIPISLKFHKFHLINDSN